MSTAQAPTPGAGISSPLPTPTIAPAIQTPTATAGITSPVPTPTITATPIISTTPTPTATPTPTPTPSPTDSNITTDPIIGTWGGQLAGNDGISIPVKITMNTNGTFTFIGPVTEQGTWVRTNPGNYTVSTSVGQSTNCTLTGPDTLIFGNAGSQQATLTRLS